MDNGDAVALAQEVGEGMIRETGRGARVDVALQADLDGDAVVKHVGCEGAHVDDLALVQRDVLDQARAVADPVGAAELQGLPDALRAETLPRVDRDRSIHALDVLEAVILGVNSYVILQYITMAYIGLNAFTVMYLFYQISGTFRNAIMKTC